MDPSRLPAAGWLAALKHEHSLRAGMPARQGRARE